MSKTALIQITNIRPVNKNSLLATCDVQIRPWKVTFHNVSIFQKGTNRWIGMPSRKWEKDGETKYQELVTFDDADIQKRFRDQIMVCIDDYLERNPNLESEPVIKEDEEFPF